MYLLESLSSKIFGDFLSGDKGTLTLGLSYTSEGGGRLSKVFKSPSTSADEDLYYSTIYPNSCDLGTGG